MAKIWSQAGFKKTLSTSTISIGLDKSFGHETGPRPGPLSRIYDQWRSRSPSPFPTSKVMNMYIVHSSMCITKVCKKCL